MEGNGEETAGEGRGGEGRDREGKRKRGGRGERHTKTGFVVFGPRRSAGISI